MGTSVIVSQVMTALRPRIMTLISDALSAQESARLEALRLEEEKRQQALLIQQQQEAARFEALRLEEERRQQALLLQQQQQSSVSSSSSSLTSLFGSGKEHYVKFEVPGQFNQEYNIGK